MRPPRESEIPIAWAASKRLLAAWTAKFSHDSTTRDVSGARISNWRLKPLEPGAYTNDPSVSTPTATAVAARSAPLRVLNETLWNPGASVAGTETLWICQLEGGMANDRHACIPTDM